MPPLNKDELRKNLRALRANLSLAAQEAAAKNLTEAAQQLPQFKAAQRVAIYWPHDHEISPLLLMHAALDQGKKCYLPVLRVDYKQKLAFASYISTTPLVKNRYDILEPELNFANIVPLTDLDIIFTPVVGFDKNAHRLGRGGGFYDATFADLAEIPHSEWPYLVGLAYDCQEVNAIPVESNDWQLDAVVTESQLILGQNRINL